MSPEPRLTSAVLWSVGSHYAHSPQVSQQLATRKTAERANNNSLTIIRSKPFGTNDLVEADRYIANVRLENVSAWRKK